MEAADAFSPSFSEAAWRSTCLALDLPRRHFYDPRKISVVKLRPPDRDRGLAKTPQNPDDTHGGSDEAALHARLDKLSKTLGPQTRGDRKADADPPTGDPGFGNTMGAGFRVVTEIVAGVLVGGGLGWLLDRWLGTKPAMMIVLGTLGLLGGFWNVVRAAMHPPGSGPGRFGG